MSPPDEDTFALSLLLFLLWLDPGYGMNLHWTNILSFDSDPFYVARLHFDFLLTRVFISMFNLDSVSDINDLHDLCLKFISYKECTVPAIKPELLGRLLGSSPQNTLSVGNSS